MVTNLTSLNNESPFDSIRHYDKDGNEFWYARELMAVLHYVKWQKFNGVIEVAIENLETIESNTINHFLPVEVKTNGRPQLNYKLTRLACYHIALSCDSRGNDAVKMAKHYFAVKTREAEVKIPQQNDRIRELEMQLEISRNQKYILDKSEAIASLHGVQMLALFQGRPDAVVEVKEKVTETMICIEGRTVSFVGKSTAELGKELGFKTGKDFEMWLVRNDAEHLICQGMRAVQAPYIPKENIKEVKRLFSIARNKVQRQMLIGE